MGADAVAITDMVDPVVPHTYGLQMPAVERVKETVSA
jgi:hypothetical protein